MKLNKKFTTRSVEIAAKLEEENHDFTKLMVESKNCNLIDANNIWMYKKLSELIIEIEELKKEHNIKIDE